MARPASRTEFKDYCLRRLGYPVVRINVDDEQVQDRIDDALAKFRDFHHDGTERAVIKFQVTAADKVNGYLTTSESVVGIVGIMWPPTGGLSGSLFDARYQMFMSDFLANRSVQALPFAMAMTHIATIQEIFQGQKPFRYNKHTDRLYIDMDWTNDLQVGEYIVAEGYTAVDPDVSTDVWSDPWLEQYATQLIKRQWGENLKKFTGVPLPGGVQMNGQVIWDEADREITKLEDSLIKDYSLPVSDMVG